MTAYEGFLLHFFRLYARLLTSYGYVSSKTVAAFVSILFEGIVIILQLSPPLRMVLLVLGNHRDGCALVFPIKSIFIVMSSCVYFI